ncbi:flavin reductase family protein [Lacisediminimonas profundi]|uniref:flavin reductase family protein n=1 Tax=Lacisediminimonas profundi TaxID=2603856 RepID=UPI00124B3580|nr:flavin reductase family protein [Lacisediminimonas profundi]
MTQIDPRALRNVLGCYATGVAIITTRSPSGEHVGVTVNSFSSVSLDPPLILFSLARTANVLATFQQATHFAVNMLGHEQQALSNMFAKPSTARFEAGSYTEGASGCALFGKSVAQLECKRASEVEGGDHVIFLGQVTDFHLRSATQPLLFYRGAYGTYARDQWSKVPPHDGTLSDFGVPGWG